MKLDKVVRAKTLIAQWRHFQKHRENGCKECDESGFDAEVFITKLVNLFAKIIREECE